VDERATRGNSIGSSKRRFQPRSATSAPVRRHALVPIEAAIFLSRPRLLIAPFLKVGFAALGQIVSPCRFERRACCLETRSAPISLLSRLTARVEAAMPLPRLGGVRDARSLDDGSYAHAGIVDVPGHRVIVDAFAGESGHAPLKRGLERSLLGGVGDPATLFKESAARIFIEPIHDVGFAS
jgi:hypothetical protein